MCSPRTRGAPGFATGPSIGLSKDRRRRLAQSPPCRSSELCTYSEPAAADDEVSEEGCLSRPVGLGSAADIAVRRSTSPPCSTGRNTGHDVIVPVRPADAVVNVLNHLGDTQQATRNHNAAHQALRQALDILDDLDHPDAKAARTKLDQLERT